MGPAKFQVSLVGPSNQGKGVSVQGKKESTRATEKKGWFHTCLTGTLMVQKTRGILTSELKVKATPARKPQSAKGHEDSIDSTEGQRVPLLHGGKRESPPEVEGKR